MRDLSQKNSGQGYDTHDLSARNTFDLGNSLHTDEHFHQLLRIEQRRAERRRSSFILMLMDIRHFDPDRIAKRDIMRGITKHLFSMTRDTDIKGWYRSGEILGVIFVDTDVADKNLTAVREGLSKKLNQILNLTLAARQQSQLAVSWYVYPDEVSALEKEGSRSKDGQRRASPLIARPTKRFQLRAKRLMDIVGSLFALILFAPLLIGIAGCVKLSSKGPVLFRQERVGLSGKKFIFLKFRSMHVDNDPTVHREYIKKFMSAEEYGVDQGKVGVFKIIHDPRVTRIGGFIRKTSLDELPQFINVLKGDMSLVGPRPPIPYECEHYHPWHLRRLQEMKPGITGLWQVGGRSTTSFDDMVRMDINYARKWSLWLDIKIIIKTPVAVLACKGAY